MTEDCKIVFRGCKRLGDTKTFYVDCSEEFALTDPVNQIASVTHAVEFGTATVSGSGYVGTDKAYVTVVGGTKLYSWCGVRLTITCANGEVFTPLIRIQLVK